jgi:nucleotide-binding universal stress UspA family protein
MSLPGNILYPVDFSDRCSHVWPAVEEMGRTLRAPITLFHVLDMQYLDSIKMSSGMESIRAYAREKLEHFPIPDSVPKVRREIAEGHAVSCIVDRARKLEAPLIVMPTRGHTRFRQLLLGSVTSGVLHDATCPVWTEAHSEEAAAPTGIYRSMVCAVDMGPRTPEVLQAASEFSRQFGASLRVVHSVVQVDPQFTSGLTARAHSFLVDKARDEFPAHCRKAGLTLPLEIVEEGGLVDGVIEAAAKYRADLLIIGRGVIQGPLGRLRTNAHELIRRSHCPVLSV